MGFFDRNKALIITTLLFSITVLALVNIKLRNSNDELAATLIDLENFDLMQEMEEDQPQDQPEPEPAPAPKTLATHQAYNQNQDESQNLNSRLNEIFERNAAASTESESEETSASNGDVSVTSTSKKEKKSQSDGDNSTEKISTKTGTLKNSSISFSLLGRNALDIPNPIYTCDRSGKVVININVDAEGNVIGTSLNKASSSTTNECLVNKALEYAAGAVFSKLPGRNAQPGTITYNFQS